MPPKKQEPSKKVETKKKEKLIEDKTFGMKNKKGAKQQKFIQTVQQQVSQMGKSAKQLAQQEKEKLEKNAKKDEKKKAIEEFNILFKPVEQKISKGTDPKSVLCAFFKAGQCTKGDKCKFSHDLNIERKAEKRSLYDDQRDEADTMDNWDEAKLEEVVSKKHAESDKLKPKTDIICKYFLDAVESNKYGWFWNCPNGEQCFYKHALPQGFVLKKDIKKEDKTNEISLEDLIEKERAALSSQNLTRVTLETFLKWKEQKRKQKVEIAKAAVDKKKTNFAAGKLFGISGRELFEFNPNLVGDDDDEADDEYNYTNDDEDEESEDQVREVNLNMFAEEMQDYIELPVDQTNTRHYKTSNDTTNSSISNDLQNNKTNQSQPSTSKHKDYDYEENIGAAASIQLNHHPHRTNHDDDEMEDIDENLFDGEDLDLVEEELENLVVVE